MLLAQLGRDARPVVLHGEHDLAVVAGHRRVDVRALRRVADGVLDQVERQAVAARRACRRRPRRRRRREVVAVGDGPELGRHLDQHAADVGRLVRELAVGVGAGQQQQVADEAAHALRGAQRRARRLAALAVEDVGQQLEVGEDEVSGVRSSCEASATNCRWRCRAPSVSSRAASSASSMACSVRGELGDLVVGGRLGDRLRRGRACAGCRARSWSAARAGASRGARAGPRPAAPGACRPGRRRTRKRRMRRMVASMSETLRPYWRTTGTTTRLGRPSRSTTLTGRLRTSTRKPPNCALRVRADEAEVRRARRLVDRRAVG